MGLILNRPSEQSIADLLQQQSEITQLERNMQLRTQNVFSGGPVATDHAFVLYTESSEFEDTLHFGEHFLLSSSNEIIEAIANGQGPKKFMLFLGYCGWDANQLNDEINRNAWLTVGADPDLVFQTPAEQQWQAAANKLGVDINLMSGGYGSA